MTVTERFILSLSALLLGVAGIVTVATVAVCKGHDGYVIASASSAITAIVTAIVSRFLSRPTKQAQVKVHDEPVRKFWMLRRVRKPRGSLQLSGMFSARAVPKAR